MKYNHFSVLEKEVLSYIDDTKPSIVLDATLGLGGHTLSILNNKKSVSNVYCIDQDKNSILIAKERLEKYSEKIKFINDNFVVISGQKEKPLSLSFIFLNILEFITL